MRRTHEVVEPNNNRLEAFHEFLQKAHLSLGYVFYCTSNIVPDVYETFYIAIIRTDEAIRKQSVVKKINLGT